MSAGFDRTLNATSKAVDSVSRAAGRPLNSAPVGGPGGASATFGGSTQPLIACEGQAGRPSQRFTSGCQRKYTTTIGRTTGTTDWTLISPVMPSTPRMIAMIETTTPSIQD